jgi:hypothetical protein
VMKNSQP